MPKRRVVFLGGKSIGAFCLKHLIENAERYNIELVAVLSKKNKSLDAAETVLSIAQEFDITILDTVADIETCDYIISVQYHEILKQQHLDKAQTLAVNLHMAPLPEYRGCNQFSYAIIDGKMEFGTTLHKMTAGIDDGDIIAEKRFPIAKDIWVEELYEKTLVASQELFEENIGNIFDGNFELISQASLLDKRGTSFHLRNEIKTLKIIDEDWSDVKKELFVRATFKEGFEKPHSIVDGKKKYYDKDSF